MEWIFVEEKLPDAGDIVLAWSKNSDELVIAGYDPENEDAWTLEDAYSTPVDVLAWMPLPSRPIKHEDMDGK